MAGLFEPVVTLHQTFSPMKKTRLLGYLLAAAACALSIPACGGGGEDGGTYVSVRQFKMGGKSFLIDGSPTMTVMGGGGEEIGTLNSERASAMFKGFTSYGGGTGDKIVSDIDDEGVYLANCTLLFSGDDVNTRISANVAYAVSGGSSGYGIMYISPQSLASAGSNSQETAALINFLSAVTASQINANGTTVYNNSVAFLNAKQVLILNLAGSTMRILYDFSRGMATVCLYYAATNDNVHVYIDANGNVHTWTGVTTPSDEETSGMTQVETVREQNVLQLERVYFAR